MAEAGEHDSHGISTTICLANSSANLDGSHLHITYLYYLWVLLKINNKTHFVGNAYIIIFSGGYGGHDENRTHTCGVGNRYSIP